MGTPPTHYAGKQGLGWFPNAKKAEVPSLYLRTYTETES